MFPASGAAEASSASLREDRRLPSWDGGESDHGRAPTKKLPKVRLGEAIEFIKAELDVTVVGDFPQQMLTVVLWELTHIRPSMTVQEFCAQTYIELH